MSTLPFNSLIICDSSGAHFGVIRFAPKEPGASKGDCIFDIHVQSEKQDERREVRWLAKRAFKKCGEHKFKLANDGALTISQGDFRVTFISDGNEDDDEAPAGYRSKPPSPVVTAFWNENE